MCGSDVISWRCSGATVFTTAIASIGPSTSTDRPPDVDRGARLVGTIERRQLRVERGVDRVGDLRLPRHDHDRPTGAVLGLGEQVGGDELGRHRAVAHHDDLRRPGKRVDADGADHLALGGRDVGVSRPDDHVDRPDGLGAVGERGDGLRTADPVHLGHPEVRGRRERRRRDLAVGSGRRAQHDLARRRRPARGSRS